MKWSDIISSPNAETLRQDENIKRWDALYKGRSDWLQNDYIDVYGTRRKRDLNIMNAAKIISQEFTSLMFSEHPDITASDRVMDVLNSNSFFTKQADAIERQIALGGQAMKVVVKDGEIIIDYVPALNFIPLSWDNTRITEAAFLDFRTRDKKNYCRVETHCLGVSEEIIDELTGEILSEAGIPGYWIINELFEVQENNIKKTDIASLMPEVVSRDFIEIETPLFVYIKNPIANNIDSETPVGISVYGNSIPTVKALDVAFDSMAEAPKLCKPRIVVSEDVTKPVYNENGKKVKFFDPSDDVFTAMPIDGDDNDPIKDMSIPLVHDPIRQQLQTLLDIFSLQAGLSSGAITFDSASGIKTATEVISENSKTYKTRQKYINAIDTGYKQLIDAIQSVLLYTGNGIPEEYSIVWDDSVIEDKNAILVYNTAKFNAGIITRWQMIMKIEKVSEEEAKKQAAEIDGTISQQQVNFVEE